VWSGLQYLYNEVGKLGLRYIPSEANFFLIELACEAKRLFEAMLCRGVIVRSMASYGMERFIRVNAGLPEENTRFALTLSQVLAEMEPTDSDGSQDRSRTRGCPELDQGSAAGSHGA
jgi:histidinol-phosphate aminotransferase